MAQPPWRDLGLIGAFLVAAGAAQTQISVNSKRLDLLEAEFVTVRRNADAVHAREAEQIRVLDARLDALDAAAPDRRLAVLEVKMQAVSAMLRRQLVWPEAGP